MQDKIGRLLEDMEKCGIKFVRLQFVDIHGTPKNMAIPLIKATDIESIIKNGIIFDGSSVEGFVDINDSDLVIKPDPDTFSTLP
ncbi:MAG TPA: hypothetical protein GX531_07160 [Methanothermobacter sp.]|nr:hypothetical protein [Methanothermobacter sp.]